MLATRPAPAPQATEAVPLLALEGVVNVCLTTFKRLGNQYPDHSGDGLIRLEGLEIAVCENDQRRRDRGFYRLTLHGGRKG